MISPSQRPLHVNTQQTQETSIHSVSGFRTRNPRHRAPQTHAFHDTATAIGHTHVTRVMLKEGRKNVNFDYTKSKNVSLQLCHTDYRSKWPPPFRQSHKQFSCLSDSFAIYRHAVLVQCRTVSADTDMLLAKWQWQLDTASRAIKWHIIIITIIIIGITISAVNFGSVSSPLCVWKMERVRSQTQLCQLTLWRRNYFSLSLAHPVYKMWIILEPNKLALWNKLHFEEKKNGE